MNSVPREGFMKIHQIIGTKDRPGPLPVSRATWYQMMKEGTAPRPVKLGARAVAWRAKDIRALLERLEADEAGERMG